MPRRKSFRSQLYRAPRDLGNVEAVEHGGSRGRSEALTRRAVFVEVERRARHDRAHCLGGLMHQIPGFVISVLAISAIWAVGSKHRVGWLSRPRPRSRGPLLDLAQAVRTTSRLCRVGGRLRAQLLALEAP